MADYAHSETDKRIAELEKRLSEEYRQAYKETKDKLEKYLNDFKRKDEKKRQEVENGTISEKDYKTWRRNQMLTGQRWADMVDTLAKDMNNVNVIAAQIVSGEMPEAFSLNANYSAYEIENGYRQNYGFTLYDRDTVDRLVSENPDLLPEPSVDIPADLRWNKQKIVSNITQAVLQGKSIPEIAKSMETVVGMNKASAVRNSRTAMTGAQNAGRQQAYERAAAMGIKLQKEWIATLDGRTRHSHGKADGQKVDINGMFSVGGCKMRYPGDVQNGTAAEIYNCRCTMCTVEPPEIMQGEEPRMTYSEWVQTKEGREATDGRYANKPLDNGGGSGIINTGAISGALNPYSKEAAKHAAQYYESVIHMKTDTSKISAATGISQDKIDKIKNHVFIAEHDLLTGRERFAPSYDMAQSWQRLINGDYKEQDIVLLKHEYAELRYMEKGYSQSEAHILASKKYNYAKYCE